MGWTPDPAATAHSKQRNSGTKGSRNDRICCVPGCGRQAVHKQTTKKFPSNVYCNTCGNELHVAGQITNYSLIMKPTPEEEERMAQERLDQAAHGSATKKAQREAGIAEIPRTAQRDVKRRYDQLMKNCGRRPEPGGLLYNPFGRALSALICACNCAINLVAARFPPQVFMFFLYLFGCTCAKKGDIVAIPLEYVAFAIAVYTLIHEKNVVDPRAFVHYRALEQDRLPRYDDSHYHSSFDPHYDDEEPRFDSIRISINAASNKETLLPMSCYRPKLDMLGEITSESVGHASRMVVEIACIVQGVETVVAVKCKRRQFVMRYLVFACTLGCCWTAALVQDFAAFQEGVAAATIDNIIESSHKGQAGVDLVDAFVKMYTPIFEMLHAFLLKAFGDRLPTVDELAVVLDRQRGKVRLAECQLQDSAVSGASAHATRRAMAGKIDTLAQAVQEDLSQSRIKEAFRTNKPGLTGWAWGAGYAAANGVSAALAYARGSYRRRRDEDDDGDERPSKSLRVGEGMPSAAEYAAAFDDSCKELEPQGSTNPRSGVRRNLLADIRRHQSKNAVHQAPIG